MTTHRNSMPVAIRGQHYPSQRAAAKALGISPSAISVMLSRKGDLSTVGLKKGERLGSKHNACPLRLGPLSFASHVEAARALGLSRFQIGRWTAPKASKTQREMLLAAVMRASAGAASARR